LDKRLEAVVSSLNYSA